MRQLFNEYIQKLEAELAANQHEENPLKRISLHIKLVEDCVYAIINDVKFQLDYDFNETTQIQYNRYLLPPLLAKLFFLKKCYLLENRKLHSTSEGSKLYCEQELEKVQRFFDTYKEFCQYYYSDKWEDDMQLFTDENCNQYPALEEYGLPDVINAGCLLAACLLTNEQYGKLLRRELEGITGTAPLPDHAVNITINGTETDVVELALAFHASDFIMIDGKPATQEFLIDYSRKITGLPLKNWPQLAQKIRARKFGDLLLLDRLKKDLSRRNERLLKSS